MAVSARLQREHARKMSSFFYQDGFLTDGVVIWKAGGMESFSDLWKAANSGWRITVLKSWQQSFPAGEGRKWQWVPTGNLVRLAEDSGCLPCTPCWLPVPAHMRKCNRSRSGHGASFIGGDLREGRKDVKHWVRKARPPTYTLVTSEFMPRAGLPLRSMSNC